MLVIVGQILGPCNNDPPTSANQTMTESKFHMCKETTDRFQYSETFFVGLAALGFLIGLFLNFHDYRQGWVLNAKHRKGSEADKAAQAKKEETQPLIN